MADFIPSEAAPDANSSGGGLDELIITKIESPTPNDAPPTDSAEPAPTLSKNALKKLRKAERFVEYKKERRAREKEAKKLKKSIAAEKRAAEDVAEGDQGGKKAKKLKQDPFKARIVVDLGFDELMIEKEIQSLCSQLLYTYSSNRNAVHPFTSLLFTSLNGNTRKRLDRLGDASYMRWRGNVQWWEDGFEKLWTNEAVKQPGTDELKEGGEVERAAKESVVYLSADAGEELSELKEGETYIIGGICDKNRYKNLCEDKAKELSIRSAQLPIGKYLAEMKTRKVLTVNQVFDILVHWTESRDWAGAFADVVPKRKFKDINEKKVEEGAGDSNGDAKVEAEPQLEDTVVVKEEGPEFHYWS
ncbi:hypothetical protein BOTBODRAFT_37566 [Botryobasidium botryosum FD-172 SS1]|uniref:tRNA (guanine(9)-N1)-methyltransferase n=1 Tax=Botryobasidium botryosum (strain FD-172 SS1) TaxID=930990 RepID=A0A067LZK1_BOTB1|nr:hypothetical protein BOTBODRAFT_37566 [Botryobasidium botryosum FD-172 SS1]